MAYSGQIVWALPNTAVVFSCYSHNVHTRENRQAFTPKYISGATEGTGSSSSYTTVCACQDTKCFWNTD